MYIVDYNLKLVDYLYCMYHHPWVILSKKPGQIASYDTIVYPFDFFTWIFTFSIIITEFIFLIGVQNLWSYASGEGNPRDYVFQGS